MPRPKKQRLKQRKDGRYCCVYKGIQFMGATEDEALARRDAFKQQEKEDAEKPMLVRDFALYWLPIAFPDIKPSTYRGHAIHMQKLVDVIGTQQLKDVTPTMVKRVYAEKYRGMSNSYIKSGRQLFCSLFDAAVADGYCRSNPARDRAAAPPKGKPVKEVKFTPQHREWIETLCTDHRCHPIAMTMLYAGLRPQEAKAIKIDRDIDFKHDIINVQSTAHVNGQKYDYTDDMKTGWSERQVPLFKPLKTALEGKEGYLITSAHGKQVTIQTWKVAWNSYKHCMETAINGMEKRWYGRTKEHKKILEAKEKLPEWIEFDITPYTLRKAFCRWCRDNHVELNTCIKWMGHKDAAMILKVYDEVSDDRSAAEAERLNSLFHMQNDMQTNSERSENVDE